jgi:hypothetical protein
MKFFPPFEDRGEVVAAWGEAQLIRFLDGKCELRGGSKEDRAEAKEWMSLFWHTAVVGEGASCAAGLKSWWALSVGHLAPPHSIPSNIKSLPGLAAKQGLNGGWEFAMLSFPCWH